jgi:ketosteroid isomerase-like protein
MPDHEAVLAANAAFYRAFNTKDAAAMEAIWATTATCTCVHPGWFLVTGREAVLETWRGILGNPAQPRVVVGGATAVVSGEMATVICREFVAGTPLLATNSFILEAGEWRIFHHQSGQVMRFEQA